MFASNGLDAITDATFERLQRAWRKDHRSDLGSLNKYLIGWKTEATSGVQSKHSNPILNSLLLDFFFFSEFSFFFLLALFFSFHFLLEWFIDINKWFGYSRSKQKRNNNKQCIYFLGKKLKSLLTHLSAWLAQLVNALTQMHVQSSTVEVQIHSRADSLTQASILPRSVKWVATFTNSLRMKCSRPCSALAGIKRVGGM